MKKLLFFLLALIFSAAGAMAQTPIYVDAARPDDSGDGLTPATAKKYIQSGITTVASGGIVNVAAGTYTENVIINKSVSLLGSAGAILNGTGLSGTGYQVKASNITIDGFEIKNYKIGIRTYGGPSNYGDLQILNCNIHHNTQNGMLFVYDIFNTVSLVNNQITANTQNGIGISNSTNIGSLIIQNSSSSSNGQHGMFIANATLNNVLIENSDFNAATSYGRCGITFGTTKSTVGSFTMNGGSLSGNTGGGLYVCQAPSTFVSMTLNGVTIQNNHESGVLLGGGGSAGNLIVENCTFQGNGSLGYEDFDLSGGWFGAFSVPGAAIFTNNFFYGGAWAKIYIGSAGSFGNININNNSFAYGAWRVFNTNSKQVDATCNWFGNVPPAANAVYGNATYIPYLTGGTDADPAVGFQPTVICTGTCDLTIELGPDQTIYYGYPPMESTTLTPIISNGTGSYTYLWSDASTANSLTVSPTIEDTYTYGLTVTDANGCLSTDYVLVNVIDVHCGNNGNKVEICHIPNGNNSNPQTICISQNAVAAHLAHGDYLGPCNIPKSLMLGQMEENYLKVYPNPFIDKTFIEFAFAKAGQVDLELFSINGEKVDQLFKGYMDESEIKIIELNAEKLSQGLYFIRMQTESDTYFEKLLIGR